MAQRISSKDQWPKAFYDNGGGSFGLVQSNKLQSGVVTANLQVGSGPLISGSTGVISGGSGGNQYFIGSGGITIGGALISSSGVATRGHYTWSDPSGGLGIDAGTTLGPFTDTIAHGLSFTPALLCFVLDDLPSLYSGFPGVPTWRPWNNQNYRTNVSRGNVSQSGNYSDAYRYDLNSFAGGPYTHAGAAAYYLQASVDNTNLYISETIYGDDAAASFPIDGIPTPDRMFTFLLYSTAVD